jgi:hypothetical protein
MEKYCAEHPSEAEYLRELLARAKAKATELGVSLLTDDAGPRKRKRKISGKGASAEGVAKGTSADDGKSPEYLEDNKLRKQHEEKVMDDALKKYKRVLHPELAEPNPPGLPERKLWTLDILGVPLPSHGETYDVEEAIKHIRKFPKRSQERGAVIELMLEGGYLRVKRTLLYKLLRRSENSKETPPSELITKEQQIGLSYEGDFVRPSIRDLVKWKGRIVLSVIPVTYHQYDNAWPGDGCLDMFRFNLQDYLKNTSTQFIDICSLVGNSDMYSRVQLGSEPTEPLGSGPTEHTISSSYCPAGIPKSILRQDYREYPINHNFARVCRSRGISRMTLILDRRKDGYWPEKKRVTKLYFDPGKYPPPNNANGTCDSIVFGHLRNYIENAAENYGSPVNCICSKTNYRLFRCRYWPRGKMMRFPSRSRSSCTFFFRVSWDEFGYFIDLNGKEHWLHNNGCGWHSCLTHNPKCLGI